MTQWQIRTRLTLLYVSILAILLVLYGGATCAVVLLQLRTQLDRLAVEDLETVEGFLSFSPDGKLALREDYHDHPYSPDMQERFLEVRGADGSLLYRDDRLGQRVLAGAPEAGEGVNSYSPRSLRLGDGTPVRVISRRHMISGRPTLIRLGFSEEPLWQRFWQLVLSLVIGLPFALALAGVAGYYLARRALSPVEQMAQRAHEINAENLHARLPVENPSDELGRLARAFNETLARLERSFEQLKCFTADASHELRTPLTAIRSVGEVGLQNNLSTEEYRETIGSMLDEAGRLTQLVESLLTLSRAESGQIALRRSPQPLLPLVREAANLLEVLAEEKRQRIVVEGTDQIQVFADQAILRQVVINLIDNAIKYSPVGRVISIAVHQVNATEAGMEVRDSGPGIAIEHREKVFNRFYRIDQSRSREEGGAGLGLTISKWGAEAHGGRLELISSTDGCVFRLVLPASPIAAVQGSALPHLL